MRYQGSVADRLEIRELCESYGDAVFRHDLEDWRALWVNDAEWSHPDVGVLQGLDAIAAVVEAAFARYPHIVFTSTPGSICVLGERATGRIYTSELVTDLEQKKSRMTGLYEDEYRKDARRWFFRSRRFQILDVAGA